MCITLSHSNGEKIFGVIHKPDISPLQKVPAVLICHGLGGNRIGRHRLYVLLAELLAEQGIACLRIDFRGAGESDGKFTDMTIDSQVADALLAIRYLEEQPFVDSSAIGICGASLGGAIALLAAHQHGHLASMAFWAPFFSADPWLSQWKKLSAAVPEKDRDPIEELFFDGQVGHWRLFEQLFSLKLEEILKEMKENPILHIHGALDTLIPFTQTDLWKTIRQNSSAETEMVTLSHSDHHFSYPPDRKVLLEVTRDWFTKTLVLAKAK
jgi:dipeptidyl aminopeptidase/acylaminoacyl peptidase